MCKIRIQINKRNRFNPRLEIYSNVGPTCHHCQNTEKKESETQRCRLDKGMTLQNGCTTTEMTDKPVTQQELRDKQEAAEICALRSLLFPPKTVISTYTNLACASRNAPSSGQSMTCFI